MMNDVKKGYQNIHNSCLFKINFSLFYNIFVIDMSPDLFINMYNSLYSVGE